MSHISPTDMATNIIAKITDVMIVEKCFSFLAKKYKAVQISTDIANTDAVSMVLII